MAFEGPQIKIPGLTAAADYSAIGNQFKFVYLSAAKVVTVCSAATQEPIGVLVNRPVLGAEAEVVAIGVVKIQSDAALTAGALIGTSADGQADAKTWGTDITEFIVGRALDTTTAAAGYVTAIINCVVPVKAVTSA